MNRLSTLHLLSNWLELLLPDGAAALPVPPAGVDPDQLRRLLSALKTEPDTLDDTDLGVLLEQVLPWLWPICASEGELEGEAALPWLTQGEPRGTLAATAPSVGLLLVDEDGTLRTAGTAFMVADRLALTARHLAEADRPLFLAMPGATDPIPAEALLLHGHWDVALLGLAEPAGPALRLSATHPDRLLGRAVARLLPTGRFAPGRILGRDVVYEAGEQPIVLIDTCAHDPLSVGAPLWDPVDGAVVGLRFAQRYLGPGYDVPAWELGRDADLRAAGLAFTGVSPPGAADWASTRPNVRRMAAARPLYERRRTERPAPATGEISLLSREAPAKTVDRIVQDISRSLPYADTLPVLASVVIRDERGRTQVQASGVLMGPRLLLTADYALPDPATASRAVVRFFPDQGSNSPEVAGLAPRILFLTDKAAGYTLVATSAQTSGGRSLTEILPPRFARSTSKIAVGAVLRQLWYDPTGAGGLRVSEGKVTDASSATELVSARESANGGGGGPVVDEDGVIVALGYMGSATAGKMIAIDRRIDLLLKAAKIAWKSDVSPRLRQVFTAAVEAERKAPPLPPIELSDSMDPALISFFKSLDPTADPVRWENERIGVLVGLRQAGWAPQETPGVKLLTHTGRIVAASANRPGLTFLAVAREVLWVEASRPGSPLDALTPSERAARDVVGTSSKRHVGADLVHADGERGQNALIAVLDNGVDIFHQAFRDPSSPGKTRILGYWDQSSQGAPTPFAVLGYGPDFGKWMTEDQINAALTPGLIAGFNRAATDHGTHVASIAAGQAAGSFDGGMAPEAKLLVIRTDIEGAGGAPTSLGYSANHLIALEFVKSFAFTRDLPVVVNLSQGMNAGAHDGSSLLEAAIDDFTGSGREPGLVLVKSAGNEGDRFGHTTIDVEHNAVVELIWEGGDDFRASDRIELWFPSLNLYHFRLFVPGDDPTNDATGIGPVSPSVPSAERTTAGELPIRLTYSRFHRDNGDSMLLIEIGPLPGKAVHPGQFTLQITGERVLQGDRPISVWAERKGLMGIHFQTGDRARGTVSIPGTARSVIAVGAVQVDSLLRVPTFSSMGPTRDQREKPDLVAPGEEIMGAEAGSLDGTIAMSGTSMAAPHVSGAIALVLSARQERPRSTWPTATQLRAGLISSSRDLTGDWSKRRGYGRLDVKAFFDLMKE